MPFISAGDGDLKSAFITDAWLIDRFVGNRLFAWGRNGQGQLGDNTAINKSSPVQTIAIGVNWVAVSGGGGGLSGTSACIKVDGTLWMWGANPQGQLGDNTTVNKSSPIQTIIGNTDWLKIACGYAHTAAIKTDGSLWLWGWNSGTFAGNAGGGLGDNTTTHKSSPVQTIAGGNNWNSVSIGAYFTAAIKTDGTLWTWGRNVFGQLGDNTRLHRSSPIQTITGGTNWSNVSCGSEFTVAIKTDGTLWAWGYNGYGQLGDNTTTDKSSPIQTIAGGSNWKQVVGSTRHTIALKTDGTLWAWGRNSYGQLGDNTTTHRSSPVQVLPTGAIWKNIALGISRDNSAAIKVDGSLWSWGRNIYGQLGDNTVIAASTPIQTITAGYNWKQVACGYNNIIAVTYGD